MNKLKKIVALILAMTLCMGMTVFAAEDDSVETEISSFQEYDSWEEEVDQSIDGKYNTNPNARAALNGVLNLAQSGTKVVAQYSTVYSKDVDKIGVRNVRLMYLTSLKLWNTIVTLDDRYLTDSSVYTGAFSVTGTYGRTYMLSATHYYVNGVASEKLYNETGELKFK